MLERRLMDRFDWLEERLEWISQQLDPRLATGTPDERPIDGRDAARGLVAATPPLVHHRRPAKKSAIPPQPSPPQGRRFNLERTISAYQRLIHASPVRLEAKKCPANAARRRPAEARHQFPVPAGSPTPKASSRLPGICPKVP